MADKIVQVIANKNIASNVEYPNKSADVTVTSLTASIPTSESIVTTVVTPTLQANSMQEVTAPADYLQISNLNTTVVTPKLTSIIVNMGEESAVNPALFRRLNDYYQSTDGITVSYSGVRASLANLQDSVVTVMNFGRAFQEISVASDSFRKVNFSKGLVETTNTLSIVANFVSKTTNSLYTASDTSALTYQKNLVNLITSNDLLLTNINKGLVDTEITTDTVSIRVSFTRSFENLLDVTDDFLGEANIDDDQIALFGKGLVNQVSSLDTTNIGISPNIVEQSSILDPAALSLSTPRSENFLTQDQPRFTPNKVVASAGTVVDTVVEQIGKNLINTAALLDQPISNVSKQASDTQLIQETVSVATAKPLSSNFGLAEAVSTTWQAQLTPVSSTLSSDITVFNVANASQDQVIHTDQAVSVVSKPFEDITNNTDSLITLTNFNREFSNLVDATDDFLGAANIDDDQIALFGKSLVNSISSADNATNQVASVQLDQALFSDQPLFTTNKIIASAGTAVDIAAQQVDKSLLNSISNTDPLSISPQKVLTSTFAGTDRVTRSISKNLLNTVSGADTIEFFLFINRFFDETLSANDSGFINNQSYFASSYVEPGYVGTNTNFS